MRDYPVSAESTVEVRRPTTKEQIKERLNRNAEERKKLERLQQIFEKNPEIQETLDILRTCNIY